VIINVDDVVLISRTWNVWQTGRTEGRPCDTHCSASISESRQLERRADLKYFLSFSVRRYSADSALAAYLILKHPLITVD